MTSGTPANGPRRHPAASARRRRPPAELIAVVVLTYIAGFLAIGLGLVFILLRYVVDNGMLGGSFGVTLIGAVVILLGLFIIALASALRRGKHYARVLTTIAMAAEFALAVAALVIDVSSYWFEITLMVVAVLTVVVLWVGRGGRYFAHISEQDAAARRTGM
jgi:cation transport ATPase